MDLELNGKTALVTGASKGIGKAIARGLAHEGVRVAICSRDATSLSAAAKEIGAGARGEVIAIPGDLSRADQVQRIAEDAAGRLGRVDILVNNAGAIRGGDFLKIPDEQWTGDWSLKLMGYIRMARAVFPIMRAQGGGRIINFSDWIAKSGRPRYPGYLPYYVAKAGAIALTEALALELAPHNILVNAIAPGPILAPRGTSDEESRAVEQATPLGRWGGEIEIAKGVLALLESDFITGETIRIDGGRHLK